MPWVTRIPNRLHYDLIDRKLALPQIRGTQDQRKHLPLRGRGSIFSFDENGYLKRIPAEEVMGFFSATRSTKT